MTRSIRPGKLITSASLYTRNSRNLSSPSIPRQPTYASAQTATMESFSPPLTAPASSSPTAMLESPPLSVLPFSSLMRSIFINTVSSSPVLLPPSLKIMSVLANSNSPILNPDRNPILHWFLKKTFYAHFCAGENAREVLKTVNALKKSGFKGVILGYAKEVVLNEKASTALRLGGNSAVSKSQIEQEILPWKKGTLETVSMTEPGDFVAVKCGSQLPTFTRSY